MAGLDARGTVDINTLPAQRALRAAARAMEDVERAGKDVTVAQRAASASIANSAEKISKANVLARAEMAKTTRAAIKQAADIRNADLAAANTRKISRTESASKITNSTAIAAARVTDIEDQTAGRAALRASKLQTMELERQLALRRANEAAERATAAASVSASVGLNGMRYVLSDVARGLTTVSVAALALPALSLVTAIAWEKDFAAVIRTTGVAGKSVETLKGQFVSLVQTLPVSWAELTKIGALAGQLGIAESQIGSFTKTVAMFSATTDVSVEESATAFGRLNSLVPDVKNNFTSLGDSILKVGVNSIATEGQIVKITTQIAAIASSAGFTSKEIIGLSGALASIGVPPELSRGVTTRVFGDINKAVTEGGIALEKWGRASGMTGEQFRQSWNSDAAGTFQKFMTVLRSEGSNAALVLNDLGITSVRDVPILMRLANAADSAGKAGGLLAQTIGDANNAGGEMERQYGQISSTVAAKLQVLVQTFQALADAVGSQALGGFGDLIDGWSGSIRDLTTSLKDPVKLLGGLELPFSNAEFLAFAAGTVVVVAGLGLLLAGFAKAAEGAILMRVALTSLPAALAGASASSVATAATVGSVGTAAGKANAPVRRFSTGLSGLGKGFAITALLALPGVITAINDAVREGGTDMESVKGKILNYDDALKSLKGTATAFGEIDIFKNPKKLREGLDTLNGGFTFDRAKLDIKADTDSGLAKLSDAYKELIDSGNGDKVIKQVNDLAKSSNLTDAQVARLVYSTGSLNTYFKNLLSENGIPITEKNLVKLATGGLAAVGVEAKNAATGTEEFNEEISATQQASQDAIDALTETSSAFIDFSSAISDSTEDGVLDLAKFMETIRAQAAAQTEWQTNMGQLAAMGTSSAFLTYLTNLGPEAASLISNFAANPDAFAEAEALWVAQGGESAAGWAASFQQKQDLANAAGRAFGAGARAQLSAELNAAGADIPAIMAHYNSLLSYNQMYPQASMAEAQAAIDLFVSLQSQRVIDIQVRATMPDLNGTVSGNGRPGVYTGGQIGKVMGIPGFASGGMIPGARLPQRRMDSQLIMARPKEFVVSEPAVNKYGVGFMNALNNRKVVQGDPVQTISNKTNAPQTMVVELSPYDRRLMARGGNVNVQIAPSDVAAAANSANLSGFKKGSN